jgi:hypothetical protein
VRIAAIKGNQYIISTFSVHSLGFYNLYPSFKFKKGRLYKINTPTIVIARPADCLLFLLPALFLQYSKAAPHKGATQQQPLHAPMPVTKK